MSREELINKIIDAMSTSKGQSDEGEFPMLYDIIDAQPNAARLILRAAVEAALSKIDDEKMIIITKKEYTLLKNASRFLECLDNAGVDCWDGMTIAREEYENDVEVIE